MHKHAPPHQHGAEGVLTSGRQRAHAAPGEQARGGEGVLHSGRQRRGRAPGGGESDAPKGREGVLHSGRQAGGQSDAPGGRERAFERAFEHTRPELELGFAPALLPLSSSTH